MMMYQITQEMYQPQQQQQQQQQPETIIQHNPSKHRHLNHYDTVLVTGANGFLASWIVKLLLEEGYRVRGTVRSVEKYSKQLHQLAPDCRHRLELVEADLTKESSWLGAVHGCTYVIHTATIKPASAHSSEDEVVKPVVNGTRSLLNACAQLGSKVRRFVHTSTIAAICGDNVEDRKMYTEEDWAKLEDQYTYSKSKILAERAVWEFVQERERNRMPCFEVAVINPGYLLGPLLLNNMNDSLDTIRKMMVREMPFYMLADVTIPCCDVRDAALAHIRALKAPDAAGHRHIVTSLVEAPTLLQYAQILNEEFGDRYSISLTVLPNIMVQTYSLFDSFAWQKVGNLSKRISFDNTRMREVLKIQPIEFRKTLIDTVNAMIEKGVIPKK